MIAVAAGNQTMIKETTAIIAVILAIFVFILPRRYVLIPYIIAACLIPPDQRIVVMNLNFTSLRILIAVGMLRLFVRGEVVAIRWNAFDLLFLIWMLYRSIAYILLWSDTQAVINRSGVLYDALGFYWLFRQNIRSWADIEFVFRVLAYGVLIMAPFVAFEWKTGRNPFVYLGTVVTDIREGRYRCQASFPHSIMLGLFWANIIPIFIGCAVVTRRYLYWIAVAAGIFVILATASSTPIASVLEILLLMGLFHYRKYGRHIVYALCGLAVVLHLVMKAPVWHLISRVNIVGGSTGWHRFHLIDQAINHFSEWALIGTRNTASWGYGLGDVTNQYIGEGVTGGFVSMILLITIMVVAVRTVGRYSLCALPLQLQWLAWCICVAILGHCLSFIGVAYFGQINMLLYLSFVIVGVMYEWQFSTPQSSAVRYDEPTKQVGRN